MYNYILKKDIEEIPLNKIYNLRKGNISGYSIDIETELSSESYTYYDRVEQRDSDFEKLSNLIDNFIDKIIKDYLIIGF